jgi:transcriptional regulator with XRE-family HTH domain
MEPIPKIIKLLITEYQYDRGTLAQQFGVSSPTISRWLSGSSKPRPDVEGQVREFYRELITPKLQIKEPAMQWPLFVEELDIRETMDSILRELREILHRRGRLSSRNQAIEELAKLLFAHVMSIENGNGGITKSNVLRATKPNTCIASSLKSFVKRAYDRFLPISLSHELHPSDFELRLKGTEESLSKEIVKCFEELASEPMLKGKTGITGIDLLNDVFGKFLADSFLDEKQLGQYLTPTEVVGFMVKLAIQEMSKSELEILCDPNQCRNFGIILDPSCGVGSFLTEILRFLHQQVSEQHNHESTRKWLKQMVHHVIVGIDKSERMIKLALTNMALFGLPATRLYLANSLARIGNDSEVAASLEGKVGLILTNPPFGAEFTGQDLLHFNIARKWADKTPRKVDSELLFLERYLDWLAPGGQLLAIVPDSILTNKGLYEVLRKNISSVIELRSVISLPPVTFGSAGTSTKTSVLHLRKKPTKIKKKSAAFFAVCHDIGYTVSTREAQRTKIANGHGDLPLIIKERSLLNGFKKYGRFAETIEGKHRWDANYHITLPLELEEIIGNPNESHVFLRDVVELSQERSDPRRWGIGVFQYIEISDVNTGNLTATSKTMKCSEAPSRARKVVHSGDVLFSTVRPERRAIARVTDDQEGAICTTGFAVLRPKSINSLVLAHLLRTDFVCQQVLRNNIGIAYPAIDESCLLNILLPIPRSKLTSLNNRATAIATKENELKEIRSEFNIRFNNLLEEWSNECFSQGPKPHQ